MKNKTLYRPVGPNELELIIDSGMKAFPPRLHWQPIFYPVLNIDYAIEIAERWNRGNEESVDAGFVTSFEVPEVYFRTFKVQTVGMTYHQELWVPSENLEVFNSKIENGIKVEKAFIGRKFQLNEKMKAIMPRDL